MRSLAVVLLAAASACGTPTCISFPGPDVEPGVYQLSTLSVHPDSVPLSGLPYADAQGLELELSEDRTTATLRYELHGVAVRETWSVTILD